MEPIGRRRVTRNTDSQIEYLDIGLRAYPSGIGGIIIWNNVQQGSDDYEFGMSTSEARHLSTALDSVVRDLQQIAVDSAAGHYRRSLLWFHICRVGEPHEERLSIDVCATIEEIGRPVDVRLMYAEPNDNPMMHNLRLEIHLAQQFVTALRELIGMIEP